MDRWDKVRGFGKPSSWASRLLFSCQYKYTAPQFSARGTGISTARLRVMSPSSENKFDDMWVGHIIMSEFIRFNLTAALWTFHKHSILPSNPGAQPRGGTASEIQHERCCPPTPHLQTPDTPPPSSPAGGKNSSKTKKICEFFQTDTYLVSITGCLLHNFPQ